MICNPTETKAPQIQRRTQEFFYAEPSLQAKVKNAVNSFIFAYVFSTPLIKEHFKLPKACLICYRIALALVARKVLAVAAGYITYTATHLPKERINKLEQLATKELEKEKFIIKKISLHLSGTTYDGSVVTHEDLQNSKICTIHARGINRCFEEKMTQLAKKDKEFGSYSVFVNGPSVGYSDGLPTSYQIPAATQAAIQYAEKKLKAKKIIVLGHSFGGGFGIIGLSRHLEQYKSTDVDYLGISHCTFSDLKSIAAEKKGQIIYPLFTILGFQLDNVKAAKILSKAKVKHIVIQSKNGNDAEIPDSQSLAKALQDNNIREEKIFITSKRISHSGPLPEKKQKIFEKTIKDFIAAERSKQT